MDSFSLRLLEGLQAKLPTVSIAHRIRLGNELTRRKCSKLVPDMYAHISRTILYLSEASPINLSIQ